MVVNHDGVLGAQVHFPEDFSEVVHFAAEIDFAGGEIRKGNEPLDDLVPVGTDERLVIFTDNGEQHPALFQKQEGFNETHRPAFEDPEGALGRHPPPEGVIQVHHHQLDRIEWPEGAVHGKDFVQHGLKKLQPAGGVMLLHGGGRLNPVAVVVFVAVTERGAVGERPDHVILAGLLADAGGNLVNVHQVDVFTPGDFRSQKLVEPLHKIHDVAQIVAGLKPAERILLRHQETQDKREQLVFGVQAQHIGQVAGEIILGLQEEPLMPRPVVGQLKVGVAPNGTQGDLNDLKILGVGGRRRQFGEGVKMIELDEFALMGGVDPGGDFRQGLRETGAHGQKAQPGVGRDLEIHRGPVSGAIMPGEKPRTDDSPPGHWGVG